MQVQQPIHPSLYPVVVTTVVVGLFHSPYLDGLDFFIGGSVDDGCVGCKDDDDNDGCCGCSSSISASVVPAPMIIVAT